jgi:hypothetical protein
MGSKQNWCIRVKWLTVLFETGAAAPEHLDFGRRAAPGLRHGTVFEHAGLLRASRHGGHFGE